MADASFLPEAELGGLILRAQDGDREAYSLVIEQIRPFIHSIAGRYARRQGGAPHEDLLQTGLLAAVRSVPCFNVTAGVKFVSYAGLAARRAIHRAAFTWKHIPQAAGEEGDFIAELPDARITDGGMSHRDEAAMIRKLVDAELGERDRLLIGKKFGLYGERAHTYAELAEATGTSRQNVQQIVERALGKLRAAMSAS
jgi:RNA polymerase sporulation-specific sigma factor